METFQLRERHTGWQEHTRSQGKTTAWVGRMKFPTNNDSGKSFFFCQCHSGEGPDVLSEAFCSVKNGQTAMATFAAYPTQTQRGRGAHRPPRTRAAPRRR